MGERYINELEAQTQKAIDQINEMYKADPVKAEKELKSILKEQLENCQSTIRDLIENGPEDIRKSLQQSVVWQDVQNSLHQLNESESDPDND